MGTRVVTISTCDRCKASDEHSGVDGVLPNWRYVRVQAGEDWFLCPNCVRDIEWTLANVIRPAPKTRI